MEGLALESLDFLVRSPWWFGFVVAQMIETLFCFLLEDRLHLLKLKVLVVAAKQQSLVDTQALQARTEGSWLGSSPQRLSMLRMCQVPIDNHSVGDKLVVNRS